MIGPEGLTWENITEDYLVYYSTWHIKEAFAERVAARKWVSGTDRKYFSREAKNQFQLAQMLLSGELERYVSYLGARITNHSFSAWHKQDALERKRAKNYHAGRHDPYWHLRKDKGR